jgi:hypothetical protein
VGRRSAAAAAELSQPGREQPLARQRVRTRSDQQPRPRDRGEWNADLELWVVATAGPFIGVSPAPVEHVFPLRMGFQVAGSKSGGAILALQDQVTGRPTVARRHRPGFLQGLQKIPAEKRIVSWPFRCRRSGPVKLAASASTRYGRLGPARIGAPVPSIASDLGKPRDDPDGDRDRLDPHAHRRQLRPAE